MTDSPVPNIFHGRGILRNFRAPEAPQTQYNEEMQSCSLWTNPQVVLVGSDFECAQFASNSWDMAGD